MDKNSIAVFVDEQIEENARDLRNVQIKIQRYEQIMYLCMAMYLKSRLSFYFLLSASLDYFFEDTRIDYIAFQKARMNYNYSKDYKELLEDLAICIKSSKNFRNLRDDLTYGASLFYKILYSSSI